jgi:hypothetical protein
MAKFKIGFVGEAEVLFAMMAKLLPIDHVTVEEVTPPAPPSIQPTRVLAQQLVRHLDAPKLKPKLKPKQYKRHPSKPLDLHAGINRIIMEALADGFAHRAMDLRPLLKKGGFSENSVGSRLTNLREHGAVEQMGDGTWRLANFPTTVTTGAGLK